LPWKDEGFTRNVATKMAAADQIIQHTAKEIMKLGETNATKEND